MRCWWNNPKEYSITTDKWNSNGKKEVSLIINFDSQTRIPQNHVFFLVSYWLMRPIDESCDKSLLSNWLYFTVNPKLISAIWLDDYIIKTNYWMSFSIFRNFFLTWSCRIRSLRVLFRIRLKSQNTSKPSFTNNYLISQKVILESRFTRHFQCQKTGRYWTSGN